MILSHKHKFIFFKPRKVASTSIEVALSKSLGKSDVITPVSEFSKDLDKGDYKKVARNYNGFFNHMTPIEIKQRVGRSKWNDYFKFTIVRNPWDLVVSCYWFEKKRKKNSNEQRNYSKVLNNPLLYFRRALFEITNLGLRSFLRKNKPARNFSEFVNNFPVKYSNAKYYFDLFGRPLADYYIRFENLENDYKKVCRKLGIKPGSIPSLKSKARSSRKHYSKYYDKQTREVVTKIFNKEIKYFNYKFEKR